MGVLPEPCNLAICRGTGSMFWRGAGHGVAREGGWSVGRHFFRNSDLNFDLNSRRRRMKRRGCERHVDVFEDGLGGDSSYAVRGLDEVVPWTAGLFAAESVGKDEWLSELMSAHEKTGAVDGPTAFRIHSCFLSPFGRAGVCCTLSGFMFSPGGVAAWRKARSKWSDCTRTTSGGQLHKNCATVEFAVADWR